MNYSVQQPTESPLVGLDDMAEGDIVVVRRGRDDDPWQGTVICDPWVCKAVPAKGRIAQPCVKIQGDGMDRPSTVHLNALVYFENVTRK